MVCHLVMVGGAAARLTANLPETMTKRNLDIPEKQLADFCRRWHISEFALFGSMLRDDFDLDSDLDILVTFAPGAD
jgi:predicted nucleotidyltransferase